VNFLSRSEFQLSREAFTAMGKPDSLQIEELAAITAAFAHTACGARIEGMTDDWKQAVAKMVSGSKGAPGRT